jgi:hypothetical protein
MTHFGKIIRGKVPFFLADRGKCLRKVIENEDKYTRYDLLNQVAVL